MRVFTPFVALAIITARWAYPILATLAPLFNTQNHTILSFSNTQFEGGRYWFLFIYLIGNSIYNKISPLLGLSPKRSETEEAPAIGLSMPFSITEIQIEEYIQTLSQKHSIPEIMENQQHLSLLLSALTEPAFILLLCKRNCPIDAIGSVNVRNRFEILNPQACSTLISQRSKRIIRSTLKSKRRKVKRGWEYDFVTELVQPGGESIYRQVFTMLQFTKHGVPPTTNTLDNKEEISSLSKLGEISVTGTDTSNWSSLCKDRNPIHLSTLAAKMLGFKGKIALGNLVAAKAIEVLVQNSKVQSLGQKSTYMEVSFLRPVLLPARMEVWGQLGETKEGSLEVRIGEKPCVTLKYGGL